MTGVEDKAEVTSRAQNDVKYRRAEIGIDCVAKRFSGIRRARFESGALRNVDYTWCDRYNPDMLGVHHHQTQQ